MNFYIKKFDILDLAFSDVFWLLIRDISSSLKSVIDTIPESTDSSVLEEKSKQGNPFGLMRIVMGTEDRDQVCADPENKIRKRRELSDGIIDGLTTHLLTPLFEMAAGLERCISQIDEKERHSRCREDIALLFDLIKTLNPALDIDHMKVEST